MSFLYTCERCEDLTENAPDHRGRVRCEDCGRASAAAGAVVNPTQRAEMSAAPATPYDDPEHMARVALAVAHTYKLLTGAA